MHLPPFSMFQGCLGTMVDGNHKELNGSCGGFEYLAKRNAMLGVFTLFPPLAYIYIRGEINAIQ